MKKTEKNALRELPLEKLRERLAQAYQERVDLRLQLKTGKLKDVHAVRKKSREIATILTFITAKLEERKAAKNG